VNGSDDSDLFNARSDDDSVESQANARLSCRTAGSSAVSQDTMALALTGGVLIFFGFQVGELMFSSTDAL